MIETRITKVIMVASLALFALLVTFDNLTDYDTNYAFVWHVLSMDTTFPGNACQSALNFDPGSASNIDPGGGSSTESTGGTCAS
jgi:predicted small integral membrane protein